MTLGRFISRDPIGDTGGKNVYAYAANQPISLKDINGLAIYPTDFIGPLGINDQRGFTAEEYKVIINIIQKELSAANGTFWDPTADAAHWGANTIGEGGLRLFNNDPGNGSIDKSIALPQGRIDLEWFTDLAVVTGTGNSAPTALYGGAKYGWMFINWIMKKFGISGAKNVIGPYQQEDENNAIRFLHEGWTYEELFSPSVLQKFRPKCL